MKFPREMYVAIDEADGEEFFVADPIATRLSVEDETRAVAKYVLVEVGEVVNESKYTTLETFE